MSSVRKVSIKEFKLLLLFAQKSHISNNEPIPEMSFENEEQVKKCLVTPFQTFFMIELYPTFTDKAVIFFYLLTKSHALINGNKRMAILTLAYFYQKNRRKLSLSDDDMYKMAIKTAKSTDKDYCLEYLKTVLSKKK
jgi:death-on-curing protein